MRVLAEFALKSPLQGMFIAAVSAAIPFMFWLSAALVALVSLRQGAAKGANLLIAALLPSLYWWQQGDPTTLIMVLGAWLLAVYLRASISWPQTLMLATAYMALVSMNIQWLTPEIMQALLQNLETQAVGDWSELGLGANFDVQAALAGIIEGLISAVQLIFLLASLMLARYWQAHLFNPGGFGTEFKALRLKSWQMLTLVLVILLAPSLGASGVFLIPLLSIPLIFAGLALVHGVLTIKDMGSTWIVLVYAGIFFVGPPLILLLILAAVIDTWVDFRGRVSR